jgi:hypothetical protein
MNGFIRKSVAAACLAAFVPVLGGCNCYRDVVDPCWPERYNAVARHNVNDVFDAQALNGHILDQTIWNYHFKTVGDDDPNTRMKVPVPTAELNYAGQQHLLYLVRRLPVPDGKIYMATARDLKVGTPIKDMAKDANELNQRRIAAIHEFLAVATAGYRTSPASFDVQIHDRPEPTYPALPISGAQRPNPVGVVVDWWNQYQGSIPQNQLSMTGTGSAP